MTYYSFSGATFLWLAIAPGQVAMAQPSSFDAARTPTEIAATTPDPSSHLDAALAMANLSTGGVQLSTAMKQMIREQLLLGVAQDTSFQDLEEDFPGVTIAVVDALMPALTRQAEETMPALIASYAALYAEEMTAKEIAIATEWYSSSAYTRLRTTMESSFDLSKIIQDVMADSESEVSSEDLETIERSSAAKAVPVMALDDKAALMRFSETSAFAKIEALKPRTRLMEAQWSNKQNPEHEAELESITIKALEEFTGLDLSE